MRVPTSCRSMTSSVDVAQHLRGRLARLAVERVDRHAAHLVARVPGLDHVFLHVGPEAVLRAEDGGQPASVPGRRRGQAVGDVAQLAVDRRRVADDADAAAVEASGRQQAVGSKRDRHGPIIGVLRLASDRAGVGRLRALGGLPRLLRPRREPIEPQVRLAPSQ